MRLRLTSILLAPALALASVSGSVTLLDGTPVAGAVVKALTDSVITSPNGAFILASATGIALRSPKNVPVASHLFIEDGRMCLAFAGADIAGRTRASATTRQKPSIPAMSVQARAAAESDTLKVYWKGKRLTVLPVQAGTSVTFRIDTAWKDDALVPWNSTVAYGSLFDSRDGQTYRTVTIGSQTWLAENLNYKVDSSWWYDNSADSGAKYGRLYTWTAAMVLDDSCSEKLCRSQLDAKHQGVCPPAWHVAAIPEWKKLSDTTLDSATSALVLKSPTGWYDNALGRGSDTKGFRALGGGFRFPSLDTFRNASYAGDFWAATEVAYTYAYYIDMFYTNSIIQAEYGGKAYAYPVRCIQD